MSVSDPPTDKPSQRSESARMMEIHSAASSRARVAFGGVHITVEDSDIDTLARTRWQAHKVLTNTYFEMAVGFIIFLNCVTVGVELELTPTGTHKAADEGETFLEVVEVIFLCIYTVELLLRLLAYRCYCLLDTWVQFDFVVVVAGFVEMILMRLRVEMAWLGLFVVLRVLRLFRLARSFKLLIRFRELAVLIKGFMSSVAITLYTCLLLFVVLFIFACVGKEIVGDWVGSEVPEDHPAEFSQAITLAKDHFANVSVSMLTLFQFVCLDSIAGIFTPIIKFQPLLFFYFIPAALIIGIVLMNLITAVMVSSCIEKAEADKDLKKQQDKEQQEALIAEVEQLFRKLDANGSDSVTEEEFQFLRLEEDHLQLIKDCLPGKSLEDIFHSIDINDDGHVDVEEFISAIYDLVQSGQTPQEVRMANQVSHMHHLLQCVLENQHTLFSHLGLGTPLGISQHNSAHQPSLRRVQRDQSHKDQQDAALGRRTSSRGKPKFEKKKPDVSVAKPFVQADWLQNGIADLRNTMEVILKDLKRPDLIGALAPSADSVRDSLDGPSMDQSPTRTVAGQASAPASANTDASPSDAKGPSVAAPSSPLISKANTVLDIVDLSPAQPPVQANSAFDMPDYA